MDDYTMEELLPLVKKLSEQFTQKESTSIRLETAKQLMEAVLYCIREYEQSKQEMQTISQEKGDNFLKNIEPIDAAKAYQLGYEAVIQKTKDANKLYSDLITDFHSYGCKSLFDTVIQVMPKFFLSYDAKFCPQNHLLILDYPTLSPIQKLTGIDRIYAYLCDLKREQTILSYFSEEEIVTSLERYHTRYEEQFFNICSVAVKHRVLQDQGKEIENLQHNKEKLFYAFTQIAQEESLYLTIIAEECWTELTAAMDRNYLNAYLEHYCDIPV